MTGRPKTPAQKVGEWQMVYRAVLDEMRTLPDDISVSDASVSYSEAITLIRTAAIVAAMLVGQNVRVPVETLTGETK